jgi:transcriptional regulator with XRE-family HTH domain
MPTKEEVGKRIKLARFRRDLTLKEVAAKSGMSATHISEIERGKTSPTIGALQRIAKALDERTSHFVEERGLCPPSLIRKDERITVFLCGADGRALSVERLTGTCPWATLQILRGLSTKPGDAYARPPMLGEVVLLCVNGMFRVTVGAETIVLREGDTAQFALDQGYRAEDIGEEKGEILGIGAYAGKPAW